MFAEAERYYAEGLAYCEERELGVYSVCLQGWRSATLGLLGRWGEAADIGAAVLGRRGISPVNRLNPLRALGSIRGRRGEAGAWELLDEALELAEGNGEPMWIVAVRAARAELSWIAGQPDLAMKRHGRATTAGSGAPTRGCSAPWPSGCPGSASRLARSPRPAGTVRAGDGR